MTTLEESKPAACPSFGIRAEADSPNVPEPCWTRLVRRSGAVPDDRVTSKFGGMACGSPGKQSRSCRTIEVETGLGRCNPLLSEMIQAPFIYVPHFRYSPDSPAHRFRPLENLGLSLESAVGDNR